MFLPRRKTRIETERLTLRQPQLSDFREWSALREQSADFLVPWDRQWTSRGGRQPQVRVGGLAGRPQT